jgi:predicted  nucleic acid-binding Zn-ribbon protein
MPTPVKDLKASLADLTSQITDADTEYQKLQGKLDATIKRTDRLGDLGESFKYDAAKSTQDRLNRLAFAAKAKVDKLKEQAFDLMGKIEAAENADFESRLSGRRK